MALETKQLHALSKIYKEQVAEDMQKGYVVTAADKKGNTKAWKGYKAGAKKKDGTPLYTAADHLKNEEVVHEGDYHSGQGEKIQKRTKKWMDKKGQKGAPGLDAMKARTAEHKAKRGVKNEELEVNEGDTYAKQLARFEAGRRKRMKASQTYERPNWIPKDQDHSDEYGSSKGKKVKQESFSNWRHDLKEIPDYEQIPVDAKKINAKVEEKNVKNKVKINPEMAEEVQVDEGVYEKEKTKEVMGALKKRDLKKDVKKKIAADIVKKKGDTSKSDDRYSYESKLWDEVAANLTELGELNDARFKVEGYQRNPERDTRSARERRMDDPDRGINSQAFRDFMAAQQRPSKPKKKAEKK